MKARTLLFLIVLSGLMMSVGNVQAQEGPYGLIKNGGFEDGFYPWGPNDSLVANGWTPFVIVDSSAPPQYMDTAAYGGFAERLDGQRCQKIWANWVPFDAGLFQQVSGVTPGVAYLASVEWAAWESRDPATNEKNKGDLIGRRIGIDPTGGTDPNSPNVVWSMEVRSQSRSPKDDQGNLLLRVSAVAQAETITVFLRATNPQSHGQDQVFFDVVKLIVDPSQPAPTNTPVPTDTPVPPTNTPRPPTDTPIPPTDTPVPPPTDTPTSTPTITPTPTYTFTPLPTNTPRPTPTPTPVSIFRDPPPYLPGVFLCVGAFGFLGAMILAALFVWVWRQGTA